MSNIALTFGGGGATSAAVAVVIGTGPALAQMKYDPGATDSAIKIGQTTAICGPFFELERRRESAGRLLQDGEREGAG